jgi:hypothetical protein
MQSRLHAPQQQPRRREVICLEPRGFRVRKPKRGDKIWQDIQLLNQFLIEHAPALVGRKHFVTLRRRVQAVPHNNNGAGPLICAEPQQKIGEANYGARAPAVAAANGFRQGMV